MSELLLILVSLLLVGLCGVFVAAEFSFITVNRTKLSRRIAKGDKKALGVELALKSLSTQLSGAQVGITITNLAIGFLAEPTIAALMHGPLQVIGLPEPFIHGVALMLSLLIATAITMIFGELIPKNIALSHPLEVARAVEAIQRGFTSLTRYPIKLLNGTADAILRRFHVEPQEELASARSAEELSSLVRRSAEKGTLPQEMARMLERSLVFSELTALDVMTPRFRMRAIKTDDPVAAVLKLAKKTGLSRFPVIKNDLDHIVGVVHIKQVFGVAKGRRAKTNVGLIMQSPILVPSSIQLDPLLKTLRQGGMQMAVVIDEFGGTDGVVTIEDLLEELVGDVRDEHDKSGSRVRPLGEKEWSLSGLLRPDEVSESTGISLPEEEEVETIGGLIAHILERVPKVGDMVTVRVPHQHNEGETEIVLTVEYMAGHRVDRVHMKTTFKQQSEAIA